MIATAAMGSQLILKEVSGVRSQRMLCYFLQSSLLAPQCVSSGDFLL